MQRSVQQNGMAKVALVKVAVCCHDFHLHTYQRNSYDDKLIIGTANPLKKKNGNFERPPFIPEARCNLEVSLLVEVTGVDGDNKNEFIDFVQPQLHKMKMAGGDILSFHRIEVLFVDGNDLGQVRACFAKTDAGLCSH